MQELHINKWKLLLPDHVLVLHHKLLYPVGGEGDEWNELQAVTVDKIRAFIVDNL